MPKYTATGIGRKVGSIGHYQYHFSVEVEGANEQEAKLNVYKHYEHIPGGVDGIDLTLVKDDDGYQTASWEI